MQNKKPALSLTHAYSVLWFGFGIMFLLTTLLHSINQSQVSASKWLYGVSAFSLITCFCWTVSIGYIFTIKHHSKVSRIVGGLLIVMPILSLTIYSLFALSSSMEQWSNQVRGFGISGTVIGLAVIIWFRADIEQ